MTDPEPSPAAPIHHRTTDLRLCRCGRVAGQKHADNCQHVDAVRERHHIEILGEPPVGMSLDAWMGLTPDQRAQYRNTLDELRFRAAEEIRPTSTLTGVDKLRLRRIMAKMPYGGDAVGAPLSYGMLDVDSLANWLESLAAILERVGVDESRMRSQLEEHRDMMRGAGKLLSALLNAADES